MFEATPSSAARIALALSAGLLLAAPAAADQLRYAIGHPPSSYLIAGGEAFAETMAEETGGEVTVKVFPLSLLSMAETSGGLREGIADIGAVMSSYFPSDFPHTNLIMENSMILQTFGPEIEGLEGLVFSAAMTEYIMKHCPECLEEFAAQNQVFTGGAGTPGYALNCTAPVVSKEDLQGKRLRIAGANWARWSEAIGAAPVTMSGNEMLEALSQGVLDCIILSVPDVYNFGMGDAVTDITLDVPGGVYVASVSNMNRDSWQGLSREQKAAALRAAAAGSAKSLILYQQGEETVLADVEAKGVKVHRPDPELMKATAAFAAQDRETLVAYYADNHGVKRGEEIAEGLKQLVEKWSGLIHAGMTEQELAALLWQEIYSKVDLASYGQ